VSPISKNTPASPKRSKKQLPPAYTLAKRIAELALEKKAEDVLLIDLRELSSACDYFVICSAGSEPQVKAIVDHIEESLDAADRPWHVEGRSHRRWVLVDCVDVVVHVFHRETREYYMLERLWADAPREEIKDRPRKRSKAAGETSPLATGTTRKRRSTRADGAPGSGEDA